jgi:outer membrane immunogenic protein
LNRERLVAVTCVVFLALTALGSAHAADFKGFYVGGTVGGTNGKSDATTTTVFDPTAGYFASSSVPAIAAAGAQHIDPSGINGGGTAGYNFQSGVFVLGVETDFGAMNLDNSKSTTAIYPCCPTTGFTVKQTITTGWLFTLRPRIGFAAGPLLVYGTGGLAMTNANYQAVFTDTFATAHENGGKEDNLTGWTGGAGAEIKPGRHWSVKGEYLYANFGSLSTTSNNLTAFTPPVAFPSNTFTHKADLRAHIYRFGLNFHF